MKEESLGESRMKVFRKVRSANGRRSNINVLTYDMFARYVIDAIKADNFFGDKEVCKNQLVGAYMAVLVAGVGECS